MNYISSGELCDTAAILSKAIDAARTELHDQQLRAIVENNYGPQSVLEAVLQLQAVSETIGKIAGRRINNLYELAKPSERT